MLLTIDYLILNLKGKLTENKRSLYKEDVPNPFDLIRHQYGNKTFSEVYDLFFDCEKIGTLNACPRSSVIPEDLIQFQFENHLFYTYSLQDLKELVFAIVDYFDVRFDGINRLDIAHDKSDYNDTYTNLYVDLIEGRKKLKGREKNVAAYMVTCNGRTEFNGFTIGKRNSSRMLRIYNKTKALNDAKNPKSYINDYFQKNHLANTATNPVWRFEYQLNNTFFTYLREREQNITWQIFDLDFLLQLIQMAEKNHFEIVYDTGKTETNKEKPFILNEWNKIKEAIQAVTRFVAEKITKSIEPSITLQKRLIKGLFREYYINPDDLYIEALCAVVNDYKLKDWFYDKYRFYVMEFQDKEKLKDGFNETSFVDSYYTLVI